MTGSRNEKWWRLKQASNCLLQDPLETDSRRECSCVVPNCGAESRGRDCEAYSRHETEWGFPRVFGSARSYLRHESVSPLQYVRGREASSEVRVVKRYLA